MAVAVLHRKFGHFQSSPFNVLQECQLPRLAALTVGNEQKTQGRPAL
jgi:hypothetical protein